LANKHSTPVSGRFEPSLPLLPGPMPPDHTTRCRLVLRPGKGRQGHPVCGRLDPQNGSLVRSDRRGTEGAPTAQQKGRSFELRAALDLARLYNSTSRSGDAYALLAPALKGFSPTPEFPEIAEAQTLLAALTS
jgi:hypothetical protein